MTPSVFPLSDYEIFERIGKGQFGQVHRARSRRLGIDIALKRVPAAAGVEKIEAEERGARLQQEQSARHPNVVPEVYEFGATAEGDYWIAMELIHGESLADLIKRAPLATARVASIALAVAEFLDTLQSIVHSDVKPEHVMVLPDGSIRVLDFGITKRIRPTRAATMNTFVSVPYASPERLRDWQVHPNDDAWALGVMTFEMAAGCHPWERFFGSDDVSLASAIRDRERPAELPASCPPGLSAIVRKMLAPQADRRYRTARDAAEDLRLFLAGRETAAEAELNEASRRTRAVPRGDAPDPARATTTVATLPVPDVRRTAPPPLPQPPPARPAPATTLDRVVAAVRSWWPRRRQLLRRGAALLATVLVVSEVTVWIRAERLRARAPVSRIDDVPDLRAQVNSLRRWSVLGAAIPLRLSGPLTRRMLELADQSILDFRTEAPGVTKKEWQDASEALALAVDVSQDRAVHAKARYVDAHLSRIAAEGQKPAVARTRLLGAINAYKDSARLDPSSPDPYLGLARIHAYELRDVDLLQQDIQNAAQRGYQPGRRERAQMGDASRFRADAAWQRRRRARGEERTSLARQALSDYEGCAAMFGQDMVGYFKSEENFDHCSSRATTLRGELGDLAP